MTDPMEPRRWLSDEHADPVVRRLFGSGRNDAPSDKSLLAAPAAIAALLATHAVTTSAAAGAAAAGTTSAATAGAAATATAATKAITATAATAGFVPGVAVVGTAGTAAATVASPGALALLPVLMKAIGVGLVVGGAAVAAAVNVAPPRGTLSDPAPLASSPAAPQRVVRANVERRIALPAASQQPVLAAELVVPEPAREVAPVVAVSSHDSAEIAREVELLDAARASLRAGELQRSIDQLDAHARLGRRSFDPESTVLRVRTLLAMHRQADAARVAREFCLRSPNSPHANEVSRLVAEVHADDAR